MNDEKEPLVPGTIVGGKYKLVEPAGSGGMGSVWRGENLSLGNTVAIKFLHVSVSNAPEIRARFDREARICAKLGDESLHIVRVTDHGVTEEGRPYLVMELLKGESLSERLEREGRLPLPTASAIATQLCRALHVAHVAGIVHRDLKPANIFLCRGGANDLHVKLLDFGVAKATLDMDAPAVTRAGFIVGTPAYMSPEQISGQPVDARADLWAVAAIVYRMAVGAPPFGNGTIGQLGRRITSESPVPPSQLTDDLTPAFDAWVMKGLAKKPDDRFQATSDLADALADLAKDAPKEITARDVVHTSFDAPTRRAQAEAVTREAPREVIASPNSNAATVVDRPKSSTPQPRAERRDTEKTSVSLQEAENWEPPRTSSWWIVLAVFALAGAGGYLGYRMLTPPASTTSPASSSAPPAPASESTSPSASASASASTTASVTASVSAPAPASASASAIPPHVQHPLPAPTPMSTTTNTAATTTTTPTDTTAVETAQPAHAAPAPSESVKDEF